VGDRVVVRNTWHGTDREPGQKIEFAGIVIWRIAQGKLAELDDAIRSAPEDMLMLETDSPYLEPEPRSLKRNEPSLLPRVVRRLCELRDWTPEQAVEITRRNARELFRMPLG